MRETCQRLNDAKLLPPSVARKLEYEADDLIDAVGLGLEVTVDPPPWRRRPARTDWLAIRVLGWLPDPETTTPEEREYAELSARHIAALQAIASIEHLRGLPNFRDATCARVIDVQRAWGDAAQAELERLEQKMPPEMLHVQRRYASAIGSFASASALQELVDAGVLPEAVAEQARREVVQSVLNVPRQAAA
jgi:hypothetical protein